MKTATVSKLKASLSEYLREVKASEEVLVTERGRLIAKLTPAGSSATFTATSCRDGKAGFDQGRDIQVAKRLLDSSSTKGFQGLVLKSLLQERERERERKGGDLLG